MATIPRAIAAYFFLLLTVRAISRRPGGQLTPFEFVLIFLIGGMSIQAIVADDRSLVNAFCAVATIALTHVAVTYLKQRWPSIGRFVDGTPVILLDRGEWHRRTMRRHGIQEEDILAASRSMGVEREEQIKYVVLERNGDISVIKAEQ